MVFKDPAGSRQAKIELALKEKKILCSLQKKAPNKIISPATSTTKLGDLPLPVKAKPMPSKPQDWICLKKLLEYEGCLIPYCSGTSLCKCAQKTKPMPSKPQDWICPKKLLKYEGCLIPNCKGTSLCKCAQKPDNLEPAVTGFMDQEYQKFVLHLQQINEQDIAEATSMVQAQKYVMPKDMVGVTLPEDEGMSETTDTSSDDDSSSSDNSSDDGNGNIG